MYPVPACARTRGVSIQVSRKLPSGLCLAACLSGDVYRPAMELKNEGHVPWLPRFLPDGALRGVMTELEAEIYAGAIAALRKRAARQVEIARAGEAVTESGVVMRTGERAVDDRLAEASSPRQPKSKDSAMNDTHPSCQ
jgi:hypothetical protein